MESKSSSSTSGRSQRNMINFEVEKIDSFPDPFPILRSQSITSGKFRFRLLVYPLGTAKSRTGEFSENGKKFLSAFIEANPQDSLVDHWRFHDVKYSIKLVNRIHEDRSIEKEDTHTFSKAQLDRGWHNIIKLSDLMRQEAGWLGPNNSILLRGCATVDISDTLFEAMLTLEARGRFSLTSDLSALWLSGWNADMTLKTGDCELKAHSLILASRSPVFKSMISSGMIETSTKVVNIPDIPSEILKHMCCFMYTGEVDHSVWDNDVATIGLMRAASKYDLCALVALCEHKAMEHVCVENVADWLRIASEANLEKLKTHCIEFIAGHLSEVQATEAWERIMQDKNIVFELTPLLLKTICPPPAKKAKCDKS